MNWLDIIFFVLGGISVLAITGTYVFYPVIIHILASVKKKPWKKDRNFLPPVTIVVAAYNEEDVIEEKLLNFLRIEYPENKLSIVIGSDGSTDRTNEILEHYAEGDRIRWFAFERGGKMKTINRLMDEVHTPYVIFTDANTLYYKHTVEQLMQSFVDPSIGGVCGNLSLDPVNRSVGGAGENAYWSFESNLKCWEGKVAATLGATGAIYAIRRELYEDQPEDSQVADDLLLPLRILSRGKRFVYEPSARAIEGTETSMRHEFRRKIRIAVGTFNTIGEMRKLLPGLGNGVKLMIFMHKMLRWLVPFFLITLFISAAALSHHLWVRDYLFIPSLVVIVVVLAGWIAELFGKRLGSFSLPFYFFAINLALLIGWIKLLFKKNTGTWERSKHSRK